MLYSHSQNLPPDIKKLNRQLESHFGIDTESMRQMWRVSWSDDQYEKRMTDRTDAGLILLSPEVRELPKYQWIVSKWILENLVAVPSFQQGELADAKVSYECIYAFPQGKVPSFEALQFVIDLVYAAKGKKSLAKYKDPDADHPLEKQQERVDRLMEELFGDESGLLGKTFKGEGIVVPRSYEPHGE
jgi:hypothetical protein